MSQNDSTYTRYSGAFQRKVVEEIVKGKHTISSANKFYGIGGAVTIRGWMKKWGKANHLPRKVVVVLSDEIDERKKMQQELKRLKNALANEAVKNLVLESLIEVANKHYGTDIKKTLERKCRDSIY